MRQYFSTIKFSKRENIMAISVHGNVFTLRTKNSTYQMKVSEYGHLLHIYYGVKTKDSDLSYLIPRVIRSHESNPDEAGEDRIYIRCALIRRNFPQMTQEIIAFPQLSL